MLGVDCQSDGCGGERAFTVSDLASFYGASRTVGEVLRRMRCSGGCGAVWPRLASDGADTQRPRQAASRAVAGAGSEGVIVGGAHGLVENFPNDPAETSMLRCYIERMVDPSPPKGTDQFARLIAQLDVLRSRAFEEIAKALPPEKRKQIADRLRDALNRLTTRKN